MYRIVTLYPINLSNLNKKTYQNILHFRNRVVAQVVELEFKPQKGSLSLNCKKKKKKKKRKEKRKEKHLPYCT
jgi:predicted RNA-binding protein with RPS1 domain